MPFVEHDAMIQTLTADRTDQAFRVRILPRRARCDEHLFDAQVLYALLEYGAVDAVAVTQQESWRLIVWKRLDDLLGRPLGRRMCRHVEVDEVTTIVAQHDEREEDAERSRGHGEEVDSHDVLSVVGQERSPRLRWRFAGANPILVDRRIDDDVIP